MEKYGETEAARVCRAAAARPERLQADETTRAAMQRLGDHYDEVFFRQPANGAAFERILRESGFTEQDWSRGNSHLPLLAEMYEPRLYLLRELRQRSLLLHGRHDLVIPPAAIEAFRNAVADGRVHVFEDSGHFAYHEEPDDYARVVSDFVVAHQR